MSGSSAPEACTNSLVGKNATVNGSAITTYSCEAPGANAKINAFPAKTYKPGTMTPIYYRLWQPETYADYLASLEGEPELRGYLPQVTRTNRYVGMNVWYDAMEQGGINEYGLTIGETTIGGREELVNPAGLMYAFDNPENSLMSLALARARDGPGGDHHWIFGPRSTATASPTARTSLSTTGTNLGL